MRYCSIDINFLITRYAGEHPSELEPHGMSAAQPDTCKRFCRAQ